MWFSTGLASGSTCGSQLVSPQDPPSPEARPVENHMWFSTGLDWEGRNLEVEPEDAFFQGRQECNR